MGVWGEGSYQDLRKGKKKTFYPFEISASDLRKRMMADGRQTWVPGVQVEETLTSGQTERSRRPAQGSNSQRRKREKKKEHRKGKQ
jgi:hypothetical protein